MRKGIIRYHLWWLLWQPFEWLDIALNELYLFIEERRFRIEREWD